MKPSEQIELRPTVRFFAEQMELTLRKHDAKKGGRKEWLKRDPIEHLDRVYQELEELNDEVQMTISGDPLSEAVDVANFAMMVADSAGKIPVEGE